MTKVEKAESLFVGGNNCAQSVLMAFANELGMTEELAHRVACGLGGGVGRMREVCGAVSAAAVVIGMRMDGDKARAYPAVQDFCSRFKAETGSLICRDLLKGTGATVGGAPEARTEKYYQSRPCVELVKLAVSLLDERNG